jgi:valyl-tRNA synthetase
MFPSQYNQSEIEKKWQSVWREDNLYKWDPSQAREDNFVIDSPPPTVSGLLHMGHIFSFTQTDFIARFQRMLGKNVFYPIGFDDNGLPTERLVEKINDVSAVQMPREDFKELCREVIKDSEEEFRKLFRSIALSVDWFQEYRTIDDDTTKISQMSFIDLFNKGHIERKDAPTFWDPVDKTAIAQAEIEDKEKQGLMNEVIFKSEDGDDLLIATGRPELLASCVALFFNPNDERYKNLSDKFAITPIYGDKVKILSDSEVDISKGTGLVMCCTFGDIQDIVWWRRHNLKLKNCISLEGKLFNAGDFDGLYIKDARNKIIERLKANNILVAQTEVKQFVKCAERSGAPLEIIPTKQWYVKILDKKDDIVDKARQCRWYPDYMRIRLENWVNGLNQDWCISRQRYFGVRFPVWYSKRKGEEGKIIIAELNQLPLDPSAHLPKGYDRDEVEPDHDVMDTWATSSLSPQISSHAVTKDFAVDYERHKKLYPADLRPQAHEIIRTWTFYTLAKSLLHEASIPWKNLMISGWCLAADKTKMSKSKGNVVTPNELILEKGADTVRYWASNSKLGVDITYSEEVFRLGKKLINKLWNASKFVSIHLKHIEGSPTTAKGDMETGRIFESLDLWILTAISEIIDKSTKSFFEFEYSDAMKYTEDFFWNDFCDNYLELVKTRLYDDNIDNAKSRQSAIYSVHHVLKTLFCLFAPFIPHLCDELNNLLFGGSSVNKKGSWPKSEDFPHDSDSRQQGENISVILELIRKYKSIQNLSIKVYMEEVIYTGCTLKESSVKDLKNAANAKSIIYAENLENADSTFYNVNNKIGITIKKVA